MFTPVCLYCSGESDYYRDVETFVIGTVVVLAAIVLIVLLPQKIGALRFEAHDRANNLDAIQSTIQNTPYIPVDTDPTDRDLTNVPL